MPNPQPSDIQPSDIPQSDIQQAGSRQPAPVPEEQRPGHHPEHEQDKPDLDAFAERFGIVPEGDEPDTAAHVGPDDSPEEIVARQEARRELREVAERAPGRSRVRLAVMVASPFVAYVVARTATRILRRRS